MKQIIWNLLAKLLAIPAVAGWIIQRAGRTPYQHIMSADGSETYMGRWWLFNPYDRNTHKAKHWWCPWSVRVHHIMRADQDRDLHDHPWSARTVILDGWYIEQRLADDHLLAMVDAPPGAQVTEFIRRNAGDTAALRHGEYHRIDQVAEGGVWTLFITSPWQGEWGFLVAGKKVHWRTYTGDQQ
ncbi:hypothetical protein [Pseudomonas nitroreducens]|uniref:hypothetical protein n=1 Tax=Pseudomonas nitroreducens TaxID=46680 RepID=UPI003CC822EF